MGNQDDLVSIHRVYDTIESEVIKGQLEAKGIPSFLRGDNAAGSLSYLTATTGIEIIVNQSDVEEACRIIQGEEFTE